MKVLTSDTGDTLLRVLLADGGAALLVPEDVAPPVFSFPNRVDCSVNAAYVEGPYSESPILHARSCGAAVGGYNGGGTGSKSILGFRTASLLPLSSFSGLSYTWADLNPATAGLGVYANVILDVNGDGSAFKVGVVDPASVAGLNNGTTVTNLDGSKTTSFAAATQNLLIVLDLPGPPLPPGVGFVPPTVNLGGPLGAGWLNHSYSIAAILAAYPACRFAEASTGDGGLPKAPNATPQFLLITGDSTNQLIRAFRLSRVAFNGVALT